MSYLDSFGLPTGLSNAFARRPPPPPQPVNAPPPPQPIERPPIPRPVQFQPMRPPEADTSGDLSRVTPQVEKPDLSEAAAAIAQADEVMRRMRDMPFPRETSPQNLPMRRNAMTPTAGPDTGEEDPNNDNTPAGYFRRLRGTESTNDDSAVNPVTKASGRYQIQPSTFAWLARENPQLGLDPSKIFEPAQQEKAVRAYTDKSMRQLVPALGRMPTAGELYALHFLGHQGGMQFLGGLDRPTKDVVRATDFKANPWLYKYADMPASALLNRFNAMMGSAQ